MFDLHKYMESHPSPHIGKPYRNCVTKTLKETEQALADMVKDESDDSSVIDMKMKYLSASKALFIAFLPEEQESLISSKYWGAVYTVMTGPWQPEKRIHLLKKLTMLAKDMPRLREQLAQGKGPDPVEVDLPLDFAKSWIYLLLCHIHGRSETGHRACNHLRKHCGLFKNGLDAVGTVVNGKPFAELYAPLPSDILPLFVKRMLPAPDSNFPRLVDTYKIYRTNLKTRIKETSLSRSIRAEISEFVEEITISIRHMNQQNDAVTALASHFSAVCEGEDRTPACIRLLDALRTKQQKTLNELTELRNQMNNLISQDPENKESSEQRHVSAIYALAIVAIIYLPISTVSSIFGIHAGDDGDIDHGQWVFWAVALPVTVITAMVAFYGAGLLSPRKPRPLPLSPGPIQPMGAPRFPPGWLGPTGRPPMPGPPVPGPPMPGTGPRPVPNPKQL